MDLPTSISNLQLLVVVAVKEVARVTEPDVRRSIVEVCKAEGFRWVTLDLEGYQRGNLSQAPEKREATG